MTISTTANRISYSGDGISTVFPVPFPFFANADIRVYVAGVRLTTGFTTTGAGADTGSVTFSAAPASQSLIALVRVPDFLQNTALPTNGPFPAESVEQMSDKAMIGEQYLADQVSRSVHLSEGDTTVGTTLPLAAERSSKVLGFDALGALVVYDASSGVTTAGNVTFLPAGTGAVARTAQDKMRDTVSVKDFGAVGDGATDDTAAIRLALATGKRVVFPKGDYKVTGELEVVNAGQVIEFESTGGYGYGENVGANWTANTRVIASGTFAKRVRTRRLYRASAADPQDSALSVVFNVQAEGVQMLNVCIWLECDYSDTSPTNLGSDCDVGLFVGTRVGFQARDLQVIGYFRRAGALFDVTGDTDLPRFNDLAGSPYPEGTVLNGGDGTHLWNPYIRGGRVGLAVLGALPKVGQTAYSTAYYDELLGTTVTDARGSFGFSDFAVFGGRIYGPDHHSNWRRADPQLSGGVLNATSMLAEPDDAPAAVQISGLAGNSSGKLWGMRFFGTRIATFEAFRMRLNFASRIALFACHLEGRNGGRFSAAGVAIDSNDYSTISYGDVAATANAERVRFIGSVRNTRADAAPHFYGTEFTLETDSGRYMLDSGAYVEFSGDADLRFASGSVARYRQGSVTKATIGDAGIALYGTTKIIVADTGDLDLRSEAGQNVRLRVGSTSKVTITPTEVQFVDGLLNFGNGSSFPTDRRGAGSPEGLVTARIGSTYRRTDGGASTSFYVKESGTGNTGWVAK